MGRKNDTSYRKPFDPFFIGAFAVIAVFPPVPISGVPSNVILYKMAEAFVCFFR